jgi:hypothetical protein|tara:strand:+ start:782 stop:1201 length:420 start_codon:yes stop_codon:yes gene_type:complete
MPQVTITEVRNAQSLNAENTAFDVEINHPEYSWIPYTLDPDDTDMTVDNSVLLELIGSDYAAYVAPTAEEIATALAASVRGQRDELLASDVDPIAGNALRWAALTDAQRSAWGNYRTALLDLPTQAGFPNTITWPTKPE